MRKVLAVLCILLCSATAFCKAGVQLGFSLMGI